MIRLLRVVLRTLPRPVFERVRGRTVRWSLSLVRRVLLPYERAGLRPLMLREMYRAGPEAFVEYVDLVRRAGVVDPADAALADALGDVIEARRRSVN